MAKNSWIAGEIATRSKMNQPFFVQSGTVVSGDIHLQISPGRVRFPFKNTPYFSTAAQSFVLDAPTVPFHYSIFLAPDGTILASGHSALFEVPEPPQGDAEYLGTVYTGATLSTANLRGPWHATLGDSYEMRGELAASTRNRFVTSGAPLTGNDVVASNPTIAVDYAGASTLFAEVSVYEPQGTRSMLHANVSWVPSGNIHEAHPFLPSGVLRQGLAVGVRRSDATGSAPYEYITYDNHEYTKGQNPDKDEQSMFHTIAFAVPSSREVAGVLLPGESVTYQLHIIRHSSLNSLGSPQPRIRNFNFTVIPGYRAKVSALP